ncbi:transposase [uncultured Nostoc sp.]|uniref:transposase n=1 Tax=uncultured Nostoc sp. TaxID=340711 RepID=UPI0035CBA1EA
MTRRFGRALSGQRAYGTCPQQRGRNVSLIGAIALRGVVASIAIMGATDGLTFEAFISQRLVPKLWPGACVVIDNASIHHCCISTSYRRTSRSYFTLSLFLFP